MHFSNLACLLVVALLCTGCKGTGVLRNFSVTKAGDAGSVDEEMPPMRLATDANSPKSRWNNPVETEANSAGTSATATPTRLAKSTGSKPEKSNLNGALKPPAQLGDLPPAPADAVAATKTKPMSEDLNTDELMEAFENAPPEVRGLANRYAAALNLRNRKEDEPADTKSGIRLPDQDPPAKSTPATTVAATTEKKPVAPSGIQQAKGTEETSTSNNAAVAYLSDDEETPLQQNSVQQTTATTKTPPSPAPSQESGPTAKPAEMKPVVASLETASTEALMKELVQRLQPDENASADAQIRVAMRQRLLALIDQRHADAMKAIDGASPQEQQYLQSQMQALALLLDEQGTPQRSRRYNDALTHLKGSGEYLGSCNRSSRSSSADLLYRS